MTDSPAPRPDPSEVDQLRARIAELESRLADEGAREPTERPPRRSRWLAVTSAVLIVLACVLAPLSVTSVWASTIVSDTDRYVETVAPLADDPDVQADVAAAVTATVLEYIDAEQVTNDALEAIASQENAPPRLAQSLPALSVPIVNGVEDFAATEVENVLASDQFAEVWEQVNRVAHEQVTTLLEGNEGGVVSAQEDTVTLNLGPVIELVKERMVDQGFTLAENIPAVDTSFVLVQSDGVTRAQNVYSALNTLGAWLPFIALALLAGGVLLAADRRRALFRGALGVVVAMIALGVGLAVGRVLYLDALPGIVLSEAAAGSVFDTLVRFLRTGLRALAVLGLVVAIAALLTGPSPAAVRARRTTVRTIGSLRGGAEAAGWRTGRFGTWVFAHKRALRTATVIVGGGTLLFWERPTGWVVVGTAVAVLVVLALVEFLGRPPGVATVPAPRGSAEEQDQQPAPEPAGVAPGQSSDPGAR